uniref:Cilium assembly protein DZIP1 N-terminal domain-containing protein n=1 Tax=Ditylenchus dipsaci TaxID=166011 RepID=A0A915EHR8_9BILA
MFVDSKEQMCKYSFFSDWNLIDEISIPLLEKESAPMKFCKSFTFYCFARLDKTDTECTEQRLLKLFKIAQMQIHYILLTQQGLVEKLHAEKSKSKKFHKENSTFRKSMSSKPKSDSSRELFQCNECSKIFAQQLSM